MDANIAGLAGLFAATLQPDPNARKAAEAQITQAQRQPGYAQLLLSLIYNASNPSQQQQPAVRLAAAINFKNLCRTGWTDSEEHEAIVHEQDKQAVRDQLLLPLLFHLYDVSSASPPALQSQLAEAVALIAEHDFPARWPALLDELVARLSLGPQGQPIAASQLGSVTCVLNVSHSLFRRWRSAMRTNELYTTINLVLGKYADPFLGLLRQTDAALTSPEGAGAGLDAKTVQTLASALALEIQIFYDLSAQDLPPQFEDNLDKVIAPILLRWLSFSRPELAPPSSEDDEDSEAGALEQIRAGVCEVAELYAQRYLDVFGKHLGPAVQAVWEMLGACGQAQRFDALVSRAIGLLSTVVKMGNQRAMFESEATLRQFVEAIILPNVQMRQSDEELFEDNQIEYIRRDLDVTGENDTRRKAASEFTRALMQHFGQTITGIMEQYIAQYLSSYQSNPSANWKQKDTAIYLLTSIAVGGATQQHGVSSVNALIDVVKFFSDNIVADLQAAPGSVHPILQVDAIKFLYTFRNQLTREQLLSVLPLLVQHLQSDNYVTCSYAAISIERILFMKAPHTKPPAPLISSDDVRPFSEQILMACFKTMMAGGTPEKIAENDYLMKCVMRLLITSRQALAPFYQPILQQLTTILAEIAKNPSNPRFNQFVFESISALIRFVTAAQPSTLAEFENSLFAPFTAILQNDVAEFVPFVFQILAQMLEQHSGKELPQTYIGLLPPLLMPPMWESKGNVPALVRLFQSFLERGAESIVANNQIDSIMAIYQRLITSRLNDSYGFELLQSAFEHVPESVLDRYKKPVLTLMLTRLQSSKTDKFSKGFVHFLGFLGCLQKQGYPEAVIQAFDSVQPGLFPQIIQGVVVPEVAKMPPYQRRTTLVGLSRLVTESPSMLRTPNDAAVPPLLSILLPAIMTPSEAVDRTADEEEALGAFDVEEQGFQASFSQLAASVSARKDPAAFAGADLKLYLAKQLAGAHLGQAVQAAAAKSSAAGDAAGVLQTELQKAGLQL